jgi:glucokinase
MEIKWLNPDSPFDRLILAGDIGGTNTNLGLVGYKKGKFTLILETVFPSATLTSLAEPLAETLKIAKEHSPELKPEYCCISAAGPVSNNRCVMTNLSWDIDGNALTTIIGIPVMIINDFVAISYGIPTLDVEDPTQIHKLAHSDGSYAEPQPATKAVIGPGTGMGVSFLAFDGKRHIPASSEGGHMSFSPFDEDSRSFCDYMTKKLGTQPGVEVFVSGLGISNMYEWWKATKGIPSNPLFQKIEETEPSDRPKYISRASDTDPVAAEMMRLFVKMLGRFASDVSALLLPLGGLYLAGGTVQKDMRWLERDHLFMKYFEKNYNPNIRPLLQKMPVYIIKDYSISLYGAANASLNLQQAK